jgi:signal transduction histidine kinase
LHPKIFLSDSLAILQGDSLVDALNWLGNQMHDKYGLNVSIDSNGVSPRFEDTLRILLFQAVREVLFNVVKHGKTSYAFVSFKELNGQICLTVHDEGAGFDVESELNDLNRPGGLMNIRHRLSLIGCQLEISSQPGQGTRVMITIPEQQVK